MLRSMQKVGDGFQINLEGLIFIQMQGMSGALKDLFLAMRMGLTEVVLGGIENHMFLFCLQNKNGFVCPRRPFFQKSRH